MTKRDDESVHFDLLFEQAPDALIFADVEGTIRLWNANAEALFGYARSEAIGQSLDLIIPERFRAAHWRGFERAITAKETRYHGRVLTTRAAHKDGRKLYVELGFALPRNAAGELIGVLASARDGTERYLAGKAQE